MILLLLLLGKAPKLCYNNSLLCVCVDQMSNLKWNPGNFTSNNSLLLQTLILMTMTLLLEKRSQKNDRFWFVIKGGAMIIIFLSEIEKKIEIGSKYVCQKYTGLQCMDLTKHVEKCDQNIL